MFGVLQPNGWGLDKPQLGAPALRNNPHYYKLYEEFLLSEGAGSKIVGLNGTIATLNSGVTWVEGINGKVLNFDGTSGKIELNYSLGQATSVTFGGWLKPVSGSYGVIFDARTSAGLGAQGFLLYADHVTNHASFFVNYPSHSLDGPGTSNVFDGKWHFLVGTSDGSNTRIYVDGQLEGTTSTPSFSFATTPSLARIGEDFTAASYPGKIDRPFIYSRALSATEIRRIYLRQSNSVAAPTFKRWLLDPSIMKAQGQASASAGPGYAGTSQGQGSATGSGGTTKSNSLTIAGYSAFAGSIGQTYNVSQAIQGISAISELSGFGYSLSISIDGDSAAAVGEVYLQQLALSIDGVADCAIGVEYHGNVIFPIAGAAATTINGVVDFVITTPIAGQAAVNIENIFNVLYDTNAIAAMSVSALAIKGNAEQPAAIGSFSATASCVFHRTLAQTLAMTQGASYTQATGIVGNTFVMTQSVVVVASHTESVSQTLSVTSTADWARPGASTLTLSQSAVCVRVRNIAVTQTLTMGQTVSRKAVTSQSVSQTLVFNPPTQVKAPMLGGSGQFVYNLPQVIGALTSRRCIVILGTSAQSVVMPCPLFGDTYNYTGEMNLKKTMTGDTFTYVKKTATESFKYSWNLGTYKALELRAFLLAHSSELITLHNWKGETWYVYLTNNPFEFTHAARWQPSGERVDITLEFEGIRR